MTTEDFHHVSSAIPNLPGVYKFIDKAGTIIYVGKAKNLRKRVSSYFGERKHQLYKTRTMVKNATQIEFTIVESETDALLLENTLIKKFQPRYNVMLKDAKSYTYICVKNERFPRVYFTRKVTKDGSKYFGPYTSKFKTKQIFELIKNLFPIRTCHLNLEEKNILEGKFKVCLEYHIGNCLGPCVGYQTQEEYDKNIEQIKNILGGNFKPVREYILSEMEYLSNNLAFEKAESMKEKLSLLDDYQAKSLIVSQTIRDVDVFSIQSDGDWAYVNYIKVVNGSVINTDTIELKKNLDTEYRDILSYAIPILREKYNSIAPEVIVPYKFESTESDLEITIPKIGDKKKLLELSRKNLKFYILQKKKIEISGSRKQASVERILKTLKDDLHMDDIPYHIECFDNSNIQGSDGVASCVVFKNGRPSKKDYRKFSIKSVQGANDFASMKEVVSRRYARLLKEDHNLPQLVIIDGGKGQLNAAMMSMEELGLKDQITVIGIAKKLEKIYMANDPIPIYLNKKSESLKLIQQARNEAHRFALSYHRQKRSNRFLKDSLTEIKGIGRLTADKLLKQFGSVKRVREATRDELIAVIGEAKTDLIRGWQEEFNSS